MNQSCCISAVFHFISIPITSSRRTAESAAGRVCCQLIARPVLPCGPRLASAWGCWVPRVIAWCYWLPGHRHTSRVLFCNDSSLLLSFLSFLQLRWFAGSFPSPSPARILVGWEWTDWCANGYKQEKRLVKCRHSQRALAGNCGPAL